MSFKFDFADASLADYAGKTVIIAFTDGEKMLCKVVGFTSSADNDNGVASIDVICDKYDAVVGISENEIETISLIE